MIIQSFINGVYVYAFIVMPYGLTEVEQQKRISRALNKAYKKLQK